MTINIVPPPDEEKRKVRLSELELADLFAARHGAEWRFVVNKNWARNHKPRGWQHLVDSRWTKDQTLEIFDTIRRLCQGRSDERWSTVAAVERILRSDLRERHDEEAA